MNHPTFRVEAFIVPISNRGSKNDNNIIDDVKVINKLKNHSELPKIVDKIDGEEEINKNTNNEETSENIEYCNMKSNDCLPIIKIDLANSELNHDEIKKKDVEEEKKTNVNENKNIELNTIPEPIYDVPYSFINFGKIQSEKLRERFETAEYVTMQMLPSGNSKLGKGLVKTSSLMSIDERGETPENCNDEFCCHGYKNGCTATTQRPEAVTEEIFEINWMKRLEQLRAREAIVKDKEAVLFDRERLLFKKERELRILERLVKDKLKYAELYLKRCKSQTSNLTDCDLESKFSEQSKDSQSSKDTGTTEPLSLIESLESCHRIENSLLNNKKMNNELTTRETTNSSGLNSRASSSSEKVLKNPPNSRSSLFTDSSGQYQQTKTDSTSLHLTGRCTSTGLSGFSSLRIKKRPKVTYDDLDSTLSADIGDSSFVVTSKKFDPEIFKKPYAFTRSSSERRHSRINPDRLSAVLPEKDVGVHQIEEDKLLKRISDNILISHDKNTKFQHYGSIDKRTSEYRDRNSGNDSNRRHSYLDLEDGKKCKKNEIKKIKSKERPISWNEETNEWLQKKRQAYNLQTAKKILGEDSHICRDFHNKENHDSELKLNQVQKKVSKGKKFNIFR